jgi:hypothetical protein
MEKAPREYMRTFSMLLRLLKRVYTLIFDFLLFFSDLFSILIVLLLMHAYPWEINHNFDMLMYACSRRIAKSRLIMLQAECQMHVG